MSVDAFNPVAHVPAMHWQPLIDEATRQKAQQSLEEGRILILPLPFRLNLDEQEFLNPDIVAGGKSIKYSLQSNRLWGAKKTAPLLERMLKRYAVSAQHLIASLFPGYVDQLTTGNTSLRPVEAEGRVQSRRQDDRFLHIDAFPSRPSAGTRLLRVFTNVHPGEKSRVWKAGEPFGKVAQKFLPALPKPRPILAKLQHLVGITKSLRTPYDHYMLHLHDAMKMDDEYQQNADQTLLEFAPGTSWIVFSDQVSHAALSGQHMLEQTFTLPVSALADPSTAPLSVLEKLTGEKLVSAA